MPDTLQDQVAAIWARALGVKKVGLDDNFFALGGHSLLLVRLTTEIRQTFGVELPLADVMRQPQLDLLAAQIDEAVLRSNLVLAPDYEVNDDEMEVSL